MHPSRRGFICGTIASAALGVSSLELHAAATESRFVLIFLRGAMDGLDVVVPYGDRDLKTWRAGLVLPDPGRADGLADLGGFWGLHPSLKSTYGLYRSGDLLPIHCVAGPNRSRSHFEGQDMMEIGADRRMSSGWLNRLAAQLPVPPNCDNAVAIGSAPPLILHGPTPTSTWDPFHMRPNVSAGFYERIVAMHAGDPQTGAEFADGLKERRFIDQVLSGTTYDDLPVGFPRLARAASRLLAAPEGPRLAELDLDGWDTHASQRLRLAEALRTLDQGVAALRDGLGAVWRKTLVCIVTEFGRTVRMNGSAGTDHGTGTAALVLGGAVAGGRVLASWPGLALRQLFEDRDLQPTMDLRAVFKGLLGPHFGLSMSALDVVFPASESIAPALGLLQSGRSL